MLNLTMSKILAVAAIFSISTIYNANAQTSIRLGPSKESENTQPPEPKKFGSAKRCVRITNYDEETIIENICGYKIYVIYCGDLKYSNKKCGDGPGGAYYTQSVNIGPRSNSRIHPKGRFSWGACIGGIGFTNDKNFKDSPDGGYTCLR